MLVRAGGDKRCNPIAKNVDGDDLLALTLQRESASSFAFLLALVSDSFTN